MKNRTTFRLASSLFLVLLLGSCSKNEPVTPALTPVTVAHPAVSEVTSFIEFTGSVGAFQSVTNVARVEGYLTSLDFQDGSYVTKGALLFTIQQDQYIQDLNLYQAKLDYATSEYNRQEEMFKKNATSKAQVEQYLSQKQQQEANVALAKLNLSYTKIYAPFDGLLGAHQVDVGNLVGNSPIDPTAIVTIEQIKPIYVNFSVNTGDALKLRKLMSEAGIRDKSMMNKSPVFAQLEDETGYPHQGVLDFSNNSVDTSTGTIQLRGLFKNEDLAMFPGLFAAVRIPLGPPKRGLVVPDFAVLSDQEGDFVFVVTPEEVVERRSVVKGPLNGKQRAISSGLTADDRVVVNGIPNVRIGQTVQVTPQASSAEK